MLLLAAWLACVPIGAFIAFNLQGERTLIATIACILLVCFVVASRGDFSKPWVALPIPWYAGLAIAQIKLLDYRTAWGTRTAFLLLTAPLLLSGASYLVSAGTHRQVHRSVFPIVNPRPILRVVGIVLITGAVLGLLLRARLAGGVTILQGDIDQARVGARIPAPVTFLTDGFYLGMWATMAHIATKRSESSRPSIIEVALVMVAAAGVLATASRNTATIAFTVPIIFTYTAGLVERPHLRTILPLAFVGLSILSGLFFLRTQQREQQTGFEPYFYTTVVPKTPVVARPFLPVYVAFATSFETFARVTQVYPASFPYANGRYHLYWVPRQLGLVRKAQFYDATEAVSRPYYFIVATYAGPLYGDFGGGGVLLGSVLIGLGFGFARRWCFRHSSLVGAAVWSYLTYTLIFMLYEDVYRIFLLSLVYDVAVIVVVCRLAQGGGEMATDSARR